MLVSTGKTKEAIGLQLTQEQVKRLGDKDVEKYYKRYETYDCCKQGWLGCFCRLKTVEALQNNLKKDCVVTKELSIFVGNLALRYGRLLMVALTTTKHIDFSAKQADAEQSSATAE